MSEIADWSLIAVGAVLLIFCAFVWISQWYTAPSEKRRKMAYEAAERLVDAAEQMYKDQPKSGKTKFAWVMTKLAERFRDRGWEELREMTEAAVHHQNQVKAVRESVRASTPPRQNGTHE